MNKKPILALAAGILFIILIPGLAGVVLAAIGAALTWNPDPGPRRHPLSLIAPATPQCRAGGKIHGLPTGRA